MNASSERSIRTGCCLDVGQRRFELGLADEVELPGDAQQRPPRSGSVDAVTSKRGGRKAPASGSALIARASWHAMLNQAYDVAAVPAAVVGGAARSTAALDGYAPTPLHDLGGGVWLKDESGRLGLPAFKVLGASWAVERALRADPSIHDAGRRQRRQPRARGRARRRVCGG